MKNPKLRIWYDMITIAITLNAKISVIDYLVPSYYSCAVVFLTIHGRISSVKRKCLDYSFPCNRPYIITRTTFTLFLRNGNDKLYENSFMHIINFTYLNSMHIIFYENELFICGEKVLFMYLLRNDVCAHCTELVFGMQW